MRLSLLAVTVLVIFINLVEQIAALEDGNPSDSDYSYDDQTNISNDETWEENFNVKTAFTDESNLKGNESLEKTDTTTLPYSMTETSEDETKKQKLDECGDPPSVRNAMIFEGKQIRYEVGAKVTYACEFGYITDGSGHFSECLLSASETLYWSNPETRCSPRSCGDPGYVDHARKVGSVFTFPNKVSFECDDGYTMRGYGTRYCQTSGTWSGNLPTCELIFCDQPRNPENGKVSYSSLGYESELHYECEPGFILKNDQGRICSANGTWSGNEPTCIEAQCDPPVAPKYGTVQVIGDKSSVGSRALYTCNDGRVLVGSTSSKCLDTGEWTFPTPRCLEHCLVPKVEHGKIGRYVEYYRRGRFERRFEELPENRKMEEGEELYLRCEPMYEPFGLPKTDEKISCSQGEWETVPVCKPAMCRSRPPPTDHADNERANRTHGGYVVYHCNKYAKKVMRGNTTCVFGNWEGVRPVCKDLRCSVDALTYPGLIKGTREKYWTGQGFKATCEQGFKLTKENNHLNCANGIWRGHLPPCIAASCNPRVLVESEGIVADDENLVLSGGNLEVRCQEGYSPSGEQALCFRGQWLVAGKLCEESNCIVNGINNGGFSQSTRRTKINCNQYAYTRCKGWNEYPRLPFGEAISSGSSIYVSCNNGYSFQGKRGENLVTVKCSKGKWDPDPVCLPHGTQYRNEAKLSSERAEKSNTKTSANADRRLSTTKQPLMLTTKLASVLDLNKNLNSSQYPPCACTYLGSDSNLQAFVGTEKLSYRSEVKNNDKVKFLCKHFGYYRLNGASEIKCENCLSWHSSEFPDCVLPQTGDTMLQFEGNHKILPGGIIAIPNGKQLVINCFSVGIEDYPKWDVAANKEFQFFYYRDQEGRFVHAINIINAARYYDGKYQCYMNGHRPYSFDIQVISQSSVKCSKFDDSDYIIHYDKEQDVNSSAVFSCKDSRKKLKGPNVVTCLLNGQWSGEPPECKMTCPRIEETEGLTVSYPNGVYVGSIAAFHCLLPRNRSGVSTTFCKANGEWADPPAICTLPSCPLHQLFDVVPPNVVPDMEGISSDTLPYNFSLRLTCESNMMLSGSSVAICGQDGKWQVSKVHCVSGCGLPRTENSELIIDPEQDFYKFGESVSLSCSPGFVLSSEVVRLMCLGTSWSEDVLPECQKG